MWLYGREGNRLYLFFLAPIRWFSKWLPHRALSGLSWLISVPAILYVWLCRTLPEAPLPLRDYVNSIFAKLPPDKRRLVIYDQLNPAYAKYYTQDEALSLMATAPFKIEVYSRRGYSWVVIGTKSPRAMTG